MTEEAKEAPFNPEETGKVLIPKDKESKLTVTSPVARSKTMQMSTLGKSQKQASVKDEDEDSEFFIHADSLNYEHGHD